ncbi:hypothetical protein PF672P2_00059 [Parabacteroides phage PF672P2]|nr:hypothetical protein PF672P1_00016 [Parabacteroides phage PF672P1]WAX17196.1 hypothetical protein PF672P2_00059 [Parabacteroides phage PF672P2]
MKTKEFKKVADIISKVSKKHKADFPTKAFFDGKSVSIVVLKGTFSTMVKLSMPEALIPIPFEMNIADLDIIKALPDENLEFAFVSGDDTKLLCNGKEFAIKEVVDGNTLKLKETSESVKVSSDPEKYELKSESNRPETGEDIVTYCIEDGKQFKKDFKAAVSCASNDFLRPILNGVYFDRLYENVKMVSSNGYVMFMKDFCKNEDNRPDGFNVQPNIVEFLPDNVEKMIVDTWCNTVTFLSPDMTIKAPLIEGRFPAWRSVIPRYDENQYFETTRDDWNDLIKSAKELGSYSVTLRAYDGKLYAMYGDTDSLNGMVHKAIPVRYGSDFDSFIPFILSYMADVAKLLKGERIRVYAKGAGKAATYRNEYAEILQMPLMQPSIISDFWDTIDKEEGEQLPEYIAPKPKAKRAKVKKVEAEKEDFIQLIELSDGKYALIGDVSKFEKSFEGVKPVQAYVFDAEKLGEIIDLL